MLSKFRSQILRWLEFVGIGPADWIEFDEYRSDVEWEFVEFLRSRAPVWRSLGLSHNDIIAFREFSGKLVVVFEVSDRWRNSLLRTLRIDFDGVRVNLGEDECGQLVTRRNETRPDFAGSDGVADKALTLGRFAADWIERELRRPIELRWWSGTDFYHSEWVLGDTNRVIMRCDTWNQARENLGPPHHVRVVRDFSRVR